MVNNKQENSQLLKHFLNRTFFKQFSNHYNEHKFFDTVEFQLSNKCNLKCSYCYYNQITGHGKKLNPAKLSNNTKILNNLDGLLEYFLENKYFPATFELFGGEPLNQKVTYTIIDKIIDFCSNTTKETCISIPTNMSFIRDDKKIQKLEELKEKAHKYNIKIGLSASVDGKYMDSTNRKISCITNQEDYYTDEFYDKLFSYAKKNNIGFHPMIYYDNIDKWIDNFNWFQENFKKYDIPWNWLYLLEVRNDGWTTNHVKNYIKWIKYILKYCFEFLGSDKEFFIKNFILSAGECNIDNMNLFNNWSISGKGLGCSLQTAMSIRLGDLTGNSCHRLSYDRLNGYKFIQNEKGKVIDIEALNLPFYLSTISTVSKKWPYCETCLINNLCLQGCLGAQYEMFSDPFIPIPSVCMLAHGKIKAQIEFLKEHNMFFNSISYLNKHQRQQMLIFNDYLEKGE